MFDTISLDNILWALFFLGLALLLGALLLFVLKLFNLKRNIKVFQNPDTGAVQRKPEKPQSEKNVSAVHKDTSSPSPGEKSVYAYDQEPEESDEDLKENSKTFFKALIHNVKEDNVPDLGAQTTFYLILALFPFLIFLLSVLQYTPLDYETLIGNIEGLLPDEGQELILDTIEEVFTNTSGALLSFSVIGALWSSLKGAQALIKATNTAYNVEETRNFFHVKAVALVVTIGVPVVILLSFFFIVFGEVIGTYVFDFFGLSDNFIDLWNWIRFPIPIVVMILFFMLFYKLAPSLKLKFKSVFWGSLFTVVFWLLASLGFSIYVNNFSNYSNVYGSLGSIIVVILWLFISSIILIIGGEINVILSRLRRGKV